LSSLISKDQDTMSIYMYSAPSTKIQPPEKQEWLSSTTPDTAIPNTQTPENHGSTFSSLIPKNLELFTGLPPTDPTIQQLGLGYQHPPEQESADDGEADEDPPATTTDEANTKTIVTNLPSAEGIVTNLPSAEESTSQRVARWTSEWKERIRAQRRVDIAARPVYEWCAFCEKTEDLRRCDDTVAEHYKYLDFCRTGPCFKNYGEYSVSRHMNMTNGIPVCYAKTDPDSVHKDAKTSRKQKGKDLSCDYCGVKNSKVITNVAMDKGFHHVNFCMNNQCCRMYVKYVNSVQRIPYALTVVPTPIPVKRKRAKAAVQ
jgi:hypothetical protein